MTDGPGDTWDHDGKVRWSGWKDPTQGRMTVRELVDQAPAKARFYQVLTLFLGKKNRHQFIDVSNWIYPSVYIEVIDRRWKHYPCGHRALVSFDLDTGRLAPMDSDRKYAFARKGWGRFMDWLVDYRVPRYSDCGDMEKTEFC